MQPSLTANMRRNQPRRSWSTVNGSARWQSAGLFETRPDDRVIALSGRTVMPGMATCHFHSTYHEIGSVFAPFGLEDPPALMAIWGATNFRLAMECLDSRWP